MLVVTIQNQKSIYFLPSKTIYHNGYFDFFCYSKCVPQDFPNNTMFLSHMFCPKFSYFHLYRWAKGNHSIFQYKFLFLKRLQWFYFVVMGQSKWLIAKKKIGT